ncbi:hypothetical protein V8C34DRAFT_326825 [Trichoderma compactum]
MPTNEEARRERLLRLSAAQEQSSGTTLNQEQTQTQERAQTQEAQTQEHIQQSQTHCDPTNILYYHLGEGSGNVLRFRIGPDYYWIAGSGPGGSMTASEEEHFYREMEAAGVERDD